MDAGSHFERILVPVDFSAASDELIEAGKAIHVGNQHLDFAPASAKSIKYAASIARGAKNGRLLLVHATPTLDYSTLYTGPTGIALPAAVVEEIHDSARDASVQALRTLAEAYCKGVPTDYHARPGHPIDVILEESRDFQADLIVLAASGRSRVARFFVGSTADRVIRQSSCPVLVVPSEHH